MRESIESVLDVKTEEEIFQAACKVFSSGQSERLQAYRDAHGLEQSYRVAVVIQVTIPAEISGVLFTADPVSGSFVSMKGNFVLGLGEPLVAGTADAYAFTLPRPEGGYDGPPELARHAPKLYKYAVRLERQMGGAQDIEWAVAQGRLYILQSRPISTMVPGNPDTYEWNDSLSGDFFWVNTNIAEAMPDVFTPLSWSIVRALEREIQVTPGNYSWSGNICGRGYSNIGMRLSILAAFGMSVEKGIKDMNDLFGPIPENISIPLYPFSRMSLFKQFLPGAVRYVFKSLIALVLMKRQIRDNPKWCSQMEALISGATSGQRLLSLWRNETYPHNISLWISLLAGATGFIIAMTRTREKLTKLAGSEDAGLLLSHLRGSAGLASLGPAVGIAAMLRGEIEREEYLALYGHRGEHEFQLSLPSMAESEGDWLERQIGEYKNSHVDLESLLERQQARYEGALQRFAGNYPDKVKWLKSRLFKVSRYAHMREAIRSEFARLLRIDRFFALRAGELSGIGQNVFFLYIDEVLGLLSGDASALRHIPAREKSYNLYKSLPPFPSIIRGRFDPLKWASYPARNEAYYDAGRPVLPLASSRVFKGHPGSSGRVEGYVRILKGMEEGENLKTGEIIAAPSVNIGWTPLLPRAAAIITDIGAPLPCRHCRQRAWHPRRDGLRQCHLDAEDGRQGYC